MIRLASKALLASIAAVGLAGCAAFPPCDCTAATATTSALPERAALVGAWVSGSTDRPMTVYIHAAGDFALQAKKTRNWKGGYARGQWTLEDRTFTGSIDNSGIPSLPVGHEWSDTIVHLSDTDLILATPSGKIERYWREGTE